MASIKTTDIQGTDFLGGSRVTINNNFALVTESINSLLGYLDTNAQTLSNLKSITLSTNPGQTVGAQASITTFTTNGSIQVDGNAVIGSAITAQSISLSNGTGMTVNKGSLQLLDPTGTLKSSGNFLLAGQSVYSSYTTAFSAYSQLSYVSGTVTNLDMTDPSNPVGQIYMANKKGLVLDFTGYTGTGNNDVKKFQLMTSDATIGQEITLIVLLEDSLTQSATLVNTNLAFTATNPLTTGVLFNKSFGVINLVFGGLTTGWIITSTRGDITIS